MEYTGKFVTFVRPITAAFKQSIYYVNLCFSSLPSDSSALIIKLSFLCCNMNMYAWYMYTYVEMTSSKWILPATVQFLRHCKEAQLCVCFILLCIETHHFLWCQCLSPASDHRAGGERRKEAAFTTAVSATNCSY